MAIAITTPGIREDYSIGQVADDFSSFATSRDGATDLLEAIINSFEWMAHLGMNKDLAESAIDTLEPIKKSFSFMGFFHHLGKLQDQYRLYSKGEGNESSRKAFNHTLLTVSSASNSAMALDMTGLYPLKEGLKTAKTLFWGAFFLVDGVNVFHEISNVEDLRKEIEKASNPKHKEILQSKINSSYLKITMSITMVSMASIALVSIVFASLAQGILFSPVVMMGLSSAWLILNFVTYFYDKKIENDERWMSHVASGSPKSLEAPLMTSAGK